jgi:LuxR family maltose regulon positive regulatory protein
VTVPLLTTKLYIPSPHPDLVPRPRLTDRLDEGLRLGHRLTLVSAPAGYGKTTLVGGWVNSHERPTAWLSLDEGDNDPIRFLRYLIAALEKMKRGIGQTVRDALQSPQLPPLPTLVTLLINDIDVAATPLTLVLDDYHFISAEPVHEVLRFLIEHQPAPMHLVIITREDPPLPLPRLRARRQVTEFRERELRFSTEEAAAFLRQTMGLALSAEAVAALEARTEGWIAGLQLSALALQEDPEKAGAFIAAFTADNRDVMDYLVDEVLQRQSQATRDFLRQTAILDRLTAPLCDALTGRQDSQTVLNQLETANLFLIPLDHRREWYRYHHLFAEFLRTALEPEERKELHEKAAHWYETHGFIAQAIQHALAYGSASGAWDDAQRLIGMVAEETLRSGTLLTMRGWLDALPDKRVRADGKLATHMGWVIAMTGGMEPAEDYATAAETILRRTEAPDADLGVVLALRGFLAGLRRHHYAEAIRLCAESVRLLREDQVHWRIVALWIMAESQERTGAITEAIATFREALRVGLVLGGQMFVGIVEMSLALSLNNHGQRREAVALCEEAIERYTDDTGNISPWASLIFSRLGMLYYEANLLKVSRLYHDRTLALRDHPVMEVYFTIAQALAAPTLDAQGETGTALAALEKASQFATQMGLVDPDWFLAFEAHIRLQRGDLAFVLRWAENACMSPDDTPEYLTMESHLVYARLLLAQSRLSDARRWLARLELFTQEHALYRPLISVHVLQALSAERSGDWVTACERISRALELAAPQDYYRAFLDEDHRVIALLSDVREVAPAFVAQLLDYSGAMSEKQGYVSQPLLDPLTDRELEVLSLIAAGLSNGEIAEELVIATGTVKRHINNIYGKLDVHSRTQAVAKANDLRLMPKSSE